MIIKGQTYNTTPPTVRYSVKDYLDEMHSRYTEIYRKEWEQLDTLWKNEEQRWKDENRRGWTDVKMRARDQQKHNETVEALKRGFIELNQKAQNGLNEVIAEADTRFEKKARATGDKIDLQTVELLKSGICTDREIRALASDFKDNIAMLHIIAKYAEERANTTKNSNEESELRTLAYTCKTAAFNYREPLEAYAAMAKEALTRDTNKAYAYNKVLTEESYQAYSEAVKDLYISYDYNSTGAANE